MKLVILLNILFLHEFVAINYSSGPVSGNSEGCFCKLQGEVDDCKCKVETLDSINNQKIYPRLQSLLSKDYFRYFKVNLKKTCPFWSDDSRCALKDCHVDMCNQDEIPPGLKGSEPTEKKYSKEAQHEDESCEEQKELGALNTTISDSTKEALRNWTKHDDTQETFCELDDDNSSECDYVDLLLNPERYTGYKGPSAHRIWRSIYEENCFKPQEDGSTPYSPQQSLAAVYIRSEMTGLCLEQRTFYRMISGLHTSINLHLSSNYLFQDKLGFGNIKWAPNTEEFLRRFDPFNEEQGPQRLKNLYFAYLVELRALIKAAPYILEEEFYTGNEEEDKDVKSGIRDLLTVIQQAPDQFDESKLFQGDPKEAKKLKEEFRAHFMNVSRIMDCVGCDKCKLWGKLQVQGMGTALKILFSGDQIGPHSTINASQKKKFQLRRTEIVSLFNSFGRLSSSVHSIEKFRHLLS
ncbi:ERO1-like protein alpha isoform X3 [Mytilus edulis]|uniref:ERO1-like protein alpha isoform X1 n=1 Tax=Mytilus edulis TaxID=6550 RepID=UPI0039EE66BB